MSYSFVDDEKAFGPERDESQESNHEPLPTGEAVDEALSNAYNGAIISDASLLTQ